jgi:hypothetical protein
MTGSYLGDKFWEDQWQGVGMGACAFCKLDTLAAAF